MVVLTKDIKEMVKDDAKAYFDRFLWNDGKIIYKIFNPLDENWYCYDQ
jgi:hypothetical protein